MSLGVARSERHPIGQSAAVGFLGHVILLLIRYQRRVRPRTCSSTGLRTGFLARPPFAIEARRVSVGLWSEMPFSMNCFSVRLHTGHALVAGINLSV